MDPGQTAQVSIILRFILFCLMIVYSLEYILKAIKNANIANVMFLINSRLIRVVYVLTSFPFVGEHFRET